jgi:sarcosine oxidase subunit alpha
VSGAPRAAFCMMGACFDCLVTIDGVGSRQACMVPVRDGMAVTAQRGKRELGR